METNQYVPGSSHKASQALQHFFHQPTDRRINTKKTQFAVWNNKISIICQHPLVDQTARAALAGAAFLIPSPSRIELITHWWWCSCTLSPAAPPQVTHQLSDLWRQAETASGVVLLQTGPKTTRHWRTTDNTRSNSSLSKLWCVVLQFWLHGQGAVGGQSSSTRKLVQF